MIPVVKSNTFKVKHPFLIFLTPIMGTEAFRQPFTLILNVMVASQHTELPTLSNTVFNFTTLKSVSVVTAAIALCGESLQ